MIMWELELDRCFDALDSQEQEMYEVEDKVKRRLADYVKEKKLSKRKSHKMDPFWIIWNPEKYDQAPRVKFDSFENAKCSAMNLANAVPGADFHIMKYEATASSKSVTFTDNR